MFLDQLLSRYPFLPEMVAFKQIYLIVFLFASQPEIYSSFDKSCLLTPNDS